MLNRLLALFLLLPISACSAQTDAPEAKTDAPAVTRVEGRDYALIDPPARWDESDPRIEVVEVFAYTCPHCAHFEPLFQAWKAKAGDDVRPVQVPMAFGGTGEAFARVFYAAETMGVLDTIHQPTFDAFHVTKRQFGNLGDVLDFYNELGVDRDGMEANLDSFVVNGKLAQVQQVVPRWGVEGTPSLIVDGRYRVLGGPEGGQEGSLATLDYLVAKIRAERAGN